MNSRLSLFFHTVRHLRWSQWIGRIRREWRTRVAPPRLRRPSERVSLHPAIAPTIFGPDDPTTIDRARCLRDGWFEAVGRRVAVSDLSWTRPVETALFTYHLHYFSEAPGLAALWAEGDRAAGARLTALWTSWLDDTAEADSVGWDPYPTSRRIMAWIEAASLLGEVPDADSIRERILDSLWSQTDRLHRTREFDLAGNHLLKNLFALVWGSVALRPSPLDADAAVAALNAEVDAQLLRDGFHEERTPAYHLDALFDLCATTRLLRQTDTYGWRPLREAARRMDRAVRGFVLADGSIHPFGDSTPRPEASIERIRSRFGDLLGAPSAPSPTWRLEDAGFSGVRVADLSVVFDTGPFGPSHQPGHGHCDGLSLVMAVGETPVLVDPGIAGYAGDPDRRWARSTEAHNTVQFDRLEQTEIWSVFRAARRAVPGVSSVTTRDDGVELLGELRHFHLPGCTHRRSITVAHSGDRVEIRDEILGVSPELIESRLHLGPKLREGPACSDGEWSFVAEKLSVRLRAIGFDSVALGTAQVFPDWNRREPALVLTASASPSSTGAREFRFVVEVERH